MDNTNVVEVPSLFQNKTKKKFTFTTGGITIEKARSFDPVVFIPAEDILAFRYGVNWVRGYKFAFGRAYFIEIKDRRQNITKISLRSVYGIRRSIYDKAWRDIFQQLWSHYFIKIATEKLEMYKRQEVFELVGIKFLYEGIKWDMEPTILWNEIALKNYKSYFMIHHVNDINLRKSVTFATDWNAVVLQQVLKLVVKNPRPN